MLAKVMVRVRMRVKITAKLRVKQRVRTACSASRCVSIWVVTAFEHATCGPG